MASIPSILSGSASVPADPSWQWEPDLSQRTEEASRPVLSNLLKRPGIDEACLSDFLENTAITRMFILLQSKAPPSSPTKPIKNPADHFRHARLPQPALLSNDEPTTLDPALPPAPKKPKRVVALHQDPALEEKKI